MIRDSLVELEITHFTGPTPIARNGHDLDFAALCTSSRSIDFSVDDDVAEKFLNLLLVHIGHRLEQLSIGVHNPNDPILDENIPSRSTIWMSPASSHGLQSLIS